MVRKRTHPVIRTGHYDKAITRKLNTVYFCISYLEKNKHSRWTLIKKINVFSEIIRTFNKKMNPILITTAMIYIAYMTIRHIFIKSEIDGLKHITLIETTLFLGILLFFTTIIFKKNIEENKMPILIFIFTIFITSSFYNLRPLEIGNDTLGYYNLALLINDKGYTYYINNYNLLKDELYEGRVLLHPLLWPVLISFGTMIGKDVIFALFIEWIFSGLAAVSLYFLAKKIYQDSDIARKICYMFMISPIVIMYNNLPYLDVPLSFFVTTCILFYIKAHSENNKVFAIVSGFLGGGAILMNFPALILVPMLLIYTIISKKKITHYLITVAAGSSLPIILAFYNYNYISNMITAKATSDAYLLTVTKLTTQLQIITNIAGGFYYFLTYMGIPISIILIISIMTYFTKNSKNIDNKLIFTLLTGVLAVFITIKGLQPTRLLLGFYPLALLSLGYYLKYYKINHITGYIITSIIFIQIILYIGMNVV